MMNDMSGIELNFAFSGQAPEGRNIIGIGRDPMTNKIINHKKLRRSVITQALDDRPMRK
jgi:hypothetical protein